MATAVARSPGPHPPPRKKHSFISLRRDNAIDSKTEKAHANPPGHPYPRPPRAESKNKRTEPSFREGPDDRVYAFPSVGDGADDVQLTPHAARTRERTITNPLPQSRLPPLRFSGSSAFSHTPPATPTSSHPEAPVVSTSQPRFEVPMSAPIVETSMMDALVDGLNGGEQDMFASLDTLRQTRRRKRSNANSKGFHHPLYHPPLPTPPPGVKLGGPVLRSSFDSDADDDDSADETKSATRSSRSRPDSSRSHARSSRQGSTSTITGHQVQTPRRTKQLPSPPASVPPPQRNSSSQFPSPSSPADLMTTNASIDEIVRQFVQVTDSPPKSVVPSISDIIRTHAPEHARKRHKPQLSVSTPQPPSSIVDIDQQSHDDADDIVSRSSIDSIAEEVQRTLRASQKHPASTLHHTRSFPHKPNPNAYDPSESSTSTPRFAERHRSPSLSSFSTSFQTVPPSSPLPLNIGAEFKSDSNQVIAAFLKSPRLTRLVTLKRPPNSRLQVSFSDLGTPTGKPVVVFLGLGCVRYIMGLYDEMAEALGLRLIAIDRWGLGRTGNPPSNSPRGVMEWASVVEEVLDYLNIDMYSIMAHSAGAPYAMALANRAPERVKGHLCLLAPWVGAGEGASGYKWLKYVPTGLIKTAQAAEWKVQAWMLGKPPTLTHAGIEFNVHSAMTSPMAGEKQGRSNPSNSPPTGDLENDERPSLGSFSDYDDLADFQGRYASRSTVHLSEHSHAMSTPSALPPTLQEIARKRAGSKSSRLFGNLWKNGEPSGNSSPTNAKAPPKLKSLKSMTSLRGASSPKSSSRPASKQASSRPGTANDEDSHRWNRMTSSAPWSSVRPTTPRTSSASSSVPEAARGYGRSRRSISLSSASPSFHKSLPTRTEPPSPPTTGTSSIDERNGLNSAALGNALLAASHAESYKGAHADLLQILNHSRKYLGFSYSDFPHSVKVWYGDKDEKIAEGAVRWMEKTMRLGSCDVCIVKGAGHALMYNGPVVVEVLEALKEMWTE